jgi:hypothetical protein
MIIMCDRILYRKKGDLYECFRVSLDGEEEFLEKGSREDIFTWMASQGLGYVRQDVLQQDFELLCEEKHE